MDPWIDHLQDHPMGRNPSTLVHILGAVHSRSGVAIRHVLRKLQSSHDFQVKGARMIIIIMNMLMPVELNSFTHLRGDTKEEN
jgi:hypothetical protein